MHRPAKLHQPTFAAVTAKSTSTPKATSLGQPVAGDEQGVVSVDWYGPGQCRTFEIGGVRVEVRLVGRKGRRARIAVAGAGVVHRLALADGGLSAPS